MNIRFIWYTCVLSAILGLNAQDAMPLSSLSYEFSLAIDNVTRCTNAHDLTVLLKQMGNTYAYMHNGNDTVATWQEHKHEADAFLGQAAHSYVQVVHGTVLELLHDLDRALNYWKEQKLRPWHYFFTKHPSKWFQHKKQSKELEEHISCVTIALSYHAQFLGQLNHQLQVWPTLTSPQEQYDWAVRSIDIGQAILHEEVKKNPAEIKSLDYGALLQSMQDGLKESLTYQESVVHTIGKAAKPNFLVRGWIPYSTATLATLSALGYVVCNRDTVMAGIDQGKKAAEAFYDNQIQTVYVRMKALLWDVARPHNTPDPNASRWWRYNPFSARAAGNVLDYTLFNGEAGRQLQMMQLTLAMASAVPAFYVSYYASKGLWKATELLKPGHYDVERIRCCLREAQRVLNRYSGASSTSMSFEDQGMLCYYVYRLRAQITYVPTNMYYSFDADLQELESHGASIAQKLGTVNRMLVTYPFLMPGYQQ